MIKAFIFDIDGTLVDSNDFHAQAWEKAFKAHGRAITAKSVRAHMGKGADQLLPEFLTQKEIDEMGKDLGKLHDEIFKREFLIQVRPFPQVRELFKRIRDAGVRIALASSAKSVEVEGYKIIAQIGDLVEQSTSADQAEESKPEPDIFHSAMTLLGHPTPNSVLVVGDTPYDAIAATKAGLPVIGVLCGGFSEANLRSNGCRAIYQDPAEMLEKLEQILKT